MKEWNGKIDRVDWRVIVVNGDWDRSVLIWNDRMWIEWCWWDEVNVKNSENERGCVERNEVKYEWEWREKDLKERRQQLKRFEICLIER